MILGVGLPFIRLRRFFVLAGLIGLASLRGSEGLERQAHEDFLFSEGLWGVKLDIALVSW